MTSSRSFDAMSRSMSGIVRLSSVRNRSKRSSCSIGSTLVMSSTYATIESAAVDDGELVREPRRDARRHEPVLAARAVLAERVEIGEGGVALRHREAGQAILPDHGAQGTSSARPDRLEVERARVGNGARVRERLRVPAEALAQDRLVLEPVLAVRLEPIPRL